MSLGDGLALWSLVTYGVIAFFMAIPALVSYIATTKPDEIRYYARFFWLSLVWPFWLLWWLLKHIWYLWINAWGKKNA